MAVVFISPKQRQRTFLWGAAIIFLIIVGSLFLAIIFSKPKEPAPAALVFNKPKVSIDMEVFKSEQFLKLKPFEEIQLQFSYKATKDGKQVTGYITAATSQEAKKILEGRGYEFIDVREVEIGRDNPFTPY